MKFGAHCELFKIIFKAHTLMHATVESLVSYSHYKRSAGNSALLTSTGTKKKSCIILFVVLP